MTVVCCWLNESFGRKRITALSDTRITNKDASGKVSTIDECAVKLFRIRIRCHKLSSFDLNSGSWSDPYYATEIGIGFAGFCFEALTVIAHIGRALEDLVAVEDKETKPHPEGIARMAEAVITRYFKQHKRAATQNIELFLFGYSPLDSKPRLWKLTHKPQSGTKCTSLSLGNDDFHVIGDQSINEKYAKEVSDLRKQIKKHENALRKKRKKGNAFDSGLEQARHYSADSKVVEDETLKRLENAFAKSVGGVLQKMEAFEVGGKTSISFTRDDKSHILDGLPMAGLSDLGYVPIGQKMGRK